MNHPHGHTRTRRMIGVQRSYRCEGCGAEARTWTRLSSCPRCGEALSVAVISRAAFSRA